MKKMISKILAFSLCLVMAVPCMDIKADSTQEKYLALGANLSSSEQKKVLDLLGVDDVSDYQVIKVTNQEEHEYLDEYLSKSVIGSRALSSVTVEQTSDGSGVNVSTENITYCTSGMYRNALVTAGIKNADL